MYKPRLIGLCGAIGSGKSTVADYLRMRYGYQRKSFAHALKHVALDVFGPMGLEYSHVFGTQQQKAKPLPGIVNAKGEPQTGRSILEHLGTEGFRAIDPDVWVKALMLTLSYGGERYVIEDVRFPNEAEAIRKQRGLIWQVVCDESREEFATGHASDTAWRTIQPDTLLAAPRGGVQLLHRQVDAQLEGLM